MKDRAAAVVLAAVVLAPCAAGAEELLVGLVRDRDGRAVAHAALRALDASGRTVASGHSDPDGTFALDPSAAATTLVVRPEAGEPVRLAVHAGEPAIVVVRRYRAVFDVTPSPADVAALPNPAAAAVTSVRPYAVAFATATSDRYLNGGRGAVLVDGIAFYRHIDGGDALGVLPPGAAGAVALRSPLESPAYGDRAGGGVTAIDVFDGGDRAAAGSSFAFVRAERERAAVVLAQSWDPDPRTLAAARTVLMLGDGAQVTVDGLAGGARGEHEAGARVQYARAGRRGDVIASAATSGDIATPAGGAIAGYGTTIDVQMRGRGTLVPELTLRARRETGVAPGIAGSDGEDAIVAGVTFADGTTRLRALLAAQHDVDARASGTTLGATALLPSLAVDRRLGERFDLHLGAATATALTPYGALDDTAVGRASLAEAALQYAGTGRFRAEATAFREDRRTSPATRLTGTGWSLGWQIAPRLGVRAWSLVANDVAATAPPAYVVPTSPLGVGRAAAFGRSVVWFTYEAGLRIDLLDRGGALEASARAAVGTRIDLRVATYRRSGGARVTSLGLALR